MTEKSPGYVHDRFPISRKGYLKMKSELENLVGHERIAVAAAIAEALAPGAASGA
jgi:hypothetical protein